MSLQEVQTAAGATFDEAGVAQSFNNDDRALAAVNNGVAICDRSGWGVIKVTGDEFACAISIIKALTILKNYSQDKVAIRFL